MKKYYALVSVISLIALPLAACGSSDDSSTSSAATSASTSSTSSGGTASTVDISAAPEGLAFEQKTVDAKAGDVTIDFDNPASIAHDVCIEGPDGSDVGCTDQISESNATLTESLEPGDYTFYCSVPGHREAGMEGTLTVN